MWKEWKRKVSNFFFEEQEGSYEGNMIANEHETFKRDPNLGRRKLDTKMTYQYPDEEIAPFRFPVIPDKSAMDKPLRKTPKKRVEKNIRDRNKTPTRLENEEDLLIFGYNRKNLNDEIEEVPAYIRRKKEKALKQQIKEKQQKLERQQELEQKLNTNVGHTKPDELDRVFQKRDGLRIKQDTNEERSINDEQSVLNSHMEAEKRQYQRAPQFKEKLQNMQSNRKRHHREEQAQNKMQNNKNQENVQIEQKKNGSSLNEYDTIDLPNYLLNDPVEPDLNDAQWLQEQRLLLEQTLKNFNIQAKIVHVTQGPSVTRFEIQPALGVKVSKIRNLADDIKLNMAAKEIRIEAPIPGKNTVGIEVPNQYPQMVTLQEIIDSDKFKQETSPLTIALGLTIEGEPLITNIEKMPHGLIAGATGSGKSVCINSILLNLLYKANPDEVKFILIDPKMVELTPYNGIPHLIAPVITDPKAATMALKWSVNEMEERYEKFVEAGVRNIVKYNEKVKNEQSNEKLPYIIIVIDELADLMMVAPQEVEDAICRIAQKARAAGIHLLLATQRPSVDVITGLIKANIPTRIAFSVSSQVDSRTIIDTNGAEKLLGKGDMLFIENGANKRLRLQGPFVSDEEIDRVVEYLRSIGEPNYLFEQEQLLIEVAHDEEDELLMDVIEFILNEQQASTSLLQRRFKIGYNRAARLIDILYKKGIVSAQNGSKPREVLITKSQIEEALQK